MSTNRRRVTELALKKQREVMASALCALGTKWAEPEYDDSTRRCGERLLRMAAALVQET